MNAWRHEERPCSPPVTTQRRPTGGWGQLLLASHQRYRAGLVRGLFTLRRAELHVTPSRCLSPRTGLDELLSLLLHLILVLSQAACVHPILPGTRDRVWESLQLQEGSADRGATPRGISRCLDRSAPAQLPLLSAVLADPEGMVLVQLTVLRAGSTPTAANTSKPLCPK